MPNDDKKMREMMRTRNPDIDPRENRFNPDARGYMEMMYDMIDPADLRRPQSASRQMLDVPDLIPMPQTQTGRGMPMPNTAQPQMDPRLDAIIRMFSQRVG